MTEIEFGMAMKEVAGLWPKNELGHGEMKVWQMSFIRLEYDRLVKALYAYYASYTYTRPKLQGILKHYSEIQEHGISQSSGLADLCRRKMRLAGTDKEVLLQYWGDQMQQAFEVYGHSNWSENLKSAYHHKIWASLSNEVGIEEKKAREIADQQIELSDYQRQRKVGVV